MHAALAVAAAILIPVAVIAFFLWIAMRNAPVCTCDDSDYCECGGACGGRVDLGSSADAMR